MRRTGHALDGSLGRTVPRRVRRSVGSAGLVCLVVLATMLGPAATAEAFGNGTWRVPAEVAPGRYRSHSGGVCYWERLRGFGGRVRDIIANEFAAYDGPVLVQIHSGDRGFRSSNCASWRKAGGPGSRVASPGPGSWRVPGEVRPGTYRGRSGGRCYWERLRGFGGTLDEIIANDIVLSRGPVVVTVGRNDHGFHSVGCGIWRRL